MKKEKTNYSNVPYGDSLATRIAEKLQRGRILGYSHRDYCGTGFCYSDDRFQYIELQDGVFMTELESFKTKKKFIRWLSKQSDHSLARLGDDSFVSMNQTITQSRLKRFLAQ